MPCFCSHRRYGHNLCTNTDSTMFLNETNSSKILPKLKQKQTTVNNIGVIYILRSILSRYRIFFEIVVPILTIKDGVS